MKYLQNLKYSVKKVCIFYLILVGILSSLRLSVKNRVGGLVNGQNPLSVTKVIFKSDLQNDNCFVNVSFETVVFVI